MEIELGVTAGLGPEKPATLDIEELLATRLLIQGNSGSGKSHLLRRLLEQSAASVQQVIIDPEGDFVSLSDKYGHVVVDANRSESDLQVIASRVRENRISTVLNLESSESEQQMKAAAIFLNALFDAPREIWYSCLVAVDEAQLFAPSGASEGAEDIRRLSLGAMTNLMCRGRKRGLAGIIATQRLAKLAKNVAAEASNFLMGRTFLDIDMARAADLLGMDKREAEKFRDLGRGHFIGLGPAIARKSLPIKVGSVETHARGSTPKIIPLPENSREDAIDIVLAPISEPRAERRVAVPEQDTPDLLSAIDTKVQQAEAESAEAEKTMPADERQMLFRKVAAEIMEDRDAFYKPDSTLYQEFQTRIRIMRLGFTPPALEDFRKLLVVSRASIPPDRLESDRWKEALKIAAQVPEDLRSLYLSFVRSAFDEDECPSDLSLARICGSSSTGRVMRKVNALEEAGFIVIKSDMRNWRVVQLPDFDCETPAGDPKGPDHLPSTQPERQKESA